MMVMMMMMMYVTLVYAGPLYMAGTLLTLTLPMLPVDQCRIHVVVLLSHLSLITGRRWSSPLDTQQRYIVTDTDSESTLPRYKSSTLRSPLNCPSSSTPSSSSSAR